MANKTDDETSGCTFQWKIENMSHCWVKKGDVIDSPRFTADALDGTKWFLRLYPSGYLGEKFIGCYLHREKDCVGPHVVKINYQLSILDKDGLTLTEKGESNRSYTKDCTFGFDRCESREKVFVTQREAFLPEDTLTLQCVIWNTNGKPAKLEHLYARTVFKVKRRNFMWRIDKFSALKPGIKNKFNDSSIEFYLFLNEGLDFAKKLLISINSSNERIKYFSFKVSLVDSEGKKENCGTQEYFAGDLKGRVLSTLLFTEKLMENKRRYLPNDVLSLYCEYVYSKGNVSYQHCGYGVISPGTTDEATKSRNVNDVVEQETLNPVVLENDLKLMYNDAISCDMEIRTLTQVFPAHKTVLGARSPVFRSMFRNMFRNDMRENTGHVDITDLEDDTIHRMLLYLYTDSLENLHFESASNLYVAADRYQIPSLKSRSCSFLKDNLSASTACEVLILAHQHRDDDLQIFVVGFILRHHKEVFSSKGWKDFKKKNPKLAADVISHFNEWKLSDI